MNLQGKNTLVIGGAVGIGRAVCEAFAGEGANVVLADRGWVQEKRAAVQSMQALGVKAFSLEIDVTVEATIVDAIENSIGLLGHIDVLVNNAGVTGPGSPLHQQEWRTWDEIFSINLKGVAFGMKHALPHMISRGYGRIINTSSQLAHKPTGLEFVPTEMKVGRGWYVKAVPPMHLRSILAASKPKAKPWNGSRANRRNGSMNT